MNRDEDGFAESMFDPSSSKIKSEIEKEVEKRQRILDEYNMKALHQVVNDNELRHVNILKLNFLGGDGKYRESFIKFQLKPIIDYDKDNLTMGKLLKNIDLVNLNFIKTDSISNIGCQLTLPENQPFNIFNPDLLNLVVNMQIIPVKKFFLKVGTNVGNGEGDGYIKLQWKNIFGGGESLDLDTNISSNELKFKNSKSEYLINYSSPIFNNANYKFSSIFYHSLRSIDYTSFHNQSIEGMTLKFGTNFLPIENKFNHEISIENLIRSINVGLPNNNNNFRNNSLINDYFLFNAGSNFKSSITYSIIKDCRDSKYIFDKGYYVRLSNEISLFSNNKFIKSCFDYSKGYKISKNLIFNLNFKIGLINSISNNLIHPMDKFQLGGSNDIKGWLISGMGPKQMNMSIGGNYFHALGLNLFTNIPYYSDSNFKFHLFTNIGKLTNKLDNKIFNQNCISTGFGISYNHPMAAFELNWVVPITANANDALRKGLQWGIGISFL